MADQFDSASAVGATIDHSTKQNEVLPQEVGSAVNSALQQLRVRPLRSPQQRKADVIKASRNCIAHSKPHKRRIVSICRSSTRASRPAVPSAKTGSSSKRQHEQS